MFTLEASASATGIDGEAAKAGGVPPVHASGRLERACPFFVCCVDLFVKIGDKSISKEGTENEKSSLYLQLSNFTTPYRSSN
jgi:hypothetical protein